MIAARGNAVGVSDSDNRKTQQKCDEDDEENGLVKGGPRDICGNISGHALFVLRVLHRSGYSRAGGIRQIARLQSKKILTAKVAKKKPPRTQRFKMSQSKALHVDVLASGAVQS